MTSNKMCCVYGCSSRYRSGVSLHYFPSDKENFEVTVTLGSGVEERMSRRKAWALKLLMGKPVTRTSQVCSKHSRSDDFFIFRPGLSNSIYRIETVMAEFTVRRCTTNDIVTTDRFLSRVLFTDEPLLAVNGPHVVPTIDESLSANVIPLGRSVLAETKDGKIVGASLNDPPPQPYPLIYMSTSDDIKFQELFNYMEQVSKINEKSPGALEIRVIAVAEDWRNRGVARDLIKATERIAAEGGFPWVKIYCTSMYTAKLVEKLDWKLLYSMSYEEYANNFPRGMSLPGEPHTHCALYVKEICNKF